MAEARAAVDNIRVVGSLQLEAIAHRAKLRGPQAHTIEGGLVVVVPSPTHLLRLVRYKFNHVYHHFQRACWPAPVWAVLAILTACIGMAIISEHNSWFRSGPVATMLWDADSHFLGAFGLSSFLPIYLRIAYLAGYTALALMLVVALVSKLCMRVLLSYRAWMYEKKPSLFTLAWGLALRSFYLGQCSPLTYSFQSSMPRQPVPHLKDTIKTYLKTVQPLLSKEEYDKTSSEAVNFEKSAIGQKCQALLVMKSWVTGNYVSDWWEKYVYLRSRSPILINSNYYGLGYAYHIPSSKQTARAAVVAHYFACFKILLESERLAPTTMRGTVPICMRQYQRMFGLTRVPGRDTDVLRQTDSVHIAVLRNGTWWRVELLSDDKIPHSAHTIQYQLDLILSSVDGTGSEAAKESLLPALTALGRTRWAEIREDHFRHGINKLSLDEIETSMFVLHLDDRAPNTWSDTGRLSLHGGHGASRWCDKSFNIIVFANGQASMHVEHSWADAPVMAHAWEWVLCHENLADAYSSTGCLKSTKASQPTSPQQHSRAASDSSAVSSAKTVVATHTPPHAHAQTLLHVLPMRLQWHLAGRAGEVVEEAAQAAQALCNDLDLEVDCFESSLSYHLGDSSVVGYGKGFMKKQQCGPDAWIQMALQLAYFRDQGHLALTYESAAVRLFNEGRTETIRSVSAESKELVMLMQTPSATPQSKIQALRRACQQHQAYARDASCGKGVDRHLFALYVASVAMGSTGCEADWLNGALSIPYKLSTSQIPQRQTDFKVRPDTHNPTIPMCSPSGGFGPVSDEGYGVAYMMADDERTFFHVSSKRSCQKTDSARFQLEIKRALNDLRSLFLSE